MFLRVNRMGSEMKKFLVMTTILLFAEPAIAQQHRQTSVQQLLAVHSNIEATLAEQLDTANEKIAADQAEIANLKKKNAELEAKLKKEAEKK